MQRRLPLVASEPWERFVVSRDSGDALLTLYNAGAEPDPAVHEVLRRLPADHIPQFFATGRFDGRAYDVVEHVSGGALAGFDRDPDRLRVIVDELGRALASFAEAGLRHRDIRPETVLVRTPDTFDLVVTGFGSARLSDFDLEAVAPLTMTRYAAPEAIVGAVSSASDWWSLGMIALEHATGGACFDGVNDKAFLLHVVTRGMSPPAALDAETRLLLRGLLARDPLKRWSWPQVRAWLAGERVEAPDGEEEIPEGRGPALTLGGREHRRPDLYAIAASEAAHWAEARDLTLRGALPSWLEACAVEARVLSEVRRIVADADLDGDARHALSMMAINPDLPLAIEGEIVTPAWLLADPDRGYDLVVGPVSRSLDRMGREPWIGRLAARAEAVRDRAGLLEIELDEGRARVAMLASSRANLEAERDRLRKVFPDTEHPGLASVMERPRLPDEDLIMLVGAAHAQFTPLASLADAAEDLARQMDVSIDREMLPELLVCPRRDVFALVDDRTANFARCGIERVDDWADSYRVERRIALPRAAVLLSVSPGKWREPPKQQYVSDLLVHFEKRVAAGVSRGPLARFVIGRTTPRVDVASLETAHRTAESLVNHVLGRTDAPMPIDPAAYDGDENLRGRLRKLGSHAGMFRRDTGIDGRYLGFPFLLARDARARSAAVKPRIAPVFLWPVAWDLDPVGARASTIAFDREREEVRLNPALEGLLGQAEFARWRSARDDLLARPGLRVADAMDVLAHLAEPRGRTLVGVPGKDSRLAPGARTLVAAGALFNAEFTGQSVAEDLRQMRGKPLAGTAADVMLRVGERPAPLSDTSVPERERYLTEACDPSQDSALLRSRAYPGLLVEGPPGTGKSQTIVNIVGEAIGRGESVLVICQKQAALKVVQKRLDAEGLGSRLFSVTDVNRDRDTLVRALRDQLPAARSTGASALAALRRRREEKAARIESLEGEIDRRHVALHAPADGVGPSYRNVLGELIGVEAAGLVIDVPRLRATLGTLAAGELPALEETCGPLAHLWLASRYEASALSALLPFSVDAGVERTVEEDLTTFEAAEATRVASLRPQDNLEIEQPEAVREWLARAAPILDPMLPEMRRRLATWLDLFRPGPDPETDGGRVLFKLGAIRSGLKRPDAPMPSASLAEALAKIDDAALTAGIADLDAHEIRPGFFGRLMPAWRRLLGRVEAFVSAMGSDPAPPLLAELRRAASLEAAVRPHRRALDQMLATLKLPHLDAHADAAEVLDRTAATIELLGPVRSAAAVVLDCPFEAECEAAIQQGDAAGWDTFRARLSRALDRHGLRMASRTALEPLASWFPGAWLAECEALIRGGKSTAGLRLPVAEALGSLAAYQRFRARIPGLPPSAMKVFAALRQMEGQLLLVPESGLDGLVRRTLRREALLSIKGRLETEHPELLYGREELEAKVSALATLDAEMRGLNRELLGRGIDAGKLGSEAAWDDITRLAGPRKRRLRELLESGPEIGLMHLRPVWLMNPDVASKVLPLKAGLFDLVVYDEASQMPVEHAVPTLYRARRAVVSGDEKQMPPSSFFSGAVEGDDEDEPDDMEEPATEAERSAQEEGWNRREVKDCPDLLQLARAVLGTAMLQIHYRSNYRELIGFSNAAYYGGGLSVPARQPEAEIRRARPIEVVRVEGVYAAQTNLAEAERVALVLAGLWSRPAADCPSVGVVTFNRKQADLVEAALEARAGTDPEFAAVLRRERDRTQNGEDMGFFVKNVENVQGDERDVIVFSTTFGRDARGTFRRSFGVLGQAGGERRLNVAVTRARDKVILVTSMPVNEVSDWLSAGRAAGKPRDYLQAYLDYATKVDAGEFDRVRATTARLTGREAANARPGTMADGPDGFAESVEAFLSGLGHHPVRADDADDAFGLDFALIDQVTSLFGIGIECDSPRHPLLAHARAREIWRPRVLGRAVPQVHRVSSRDWYQRPQHERARLRSAVEAAMGIRMQE